MNGRKATSGRAVRDAKRWAIQYEPTESTDGVGTESLSRPAGRRMSIALVGVSAGCALLALGSMLFDPPPRPRAFNTSETLRTSPALPAPSNGDEPAQLTAAAPPPPPPPPQPVVAAAAPAKTPPETAAIATRRDATPEVAALDPIDDLAAALQASPAHDERLARTLRTAARAVRRHDRPVAVHIQSDIVAMVEARPPSRAAVTRSATRMVAALKRADRLDASIRTRAINAIAAFCEDERMPRGDRQEAIRSLRGENGVRSRVLALVGDPVVGKLAGLTYGTLDNPTVDELIGGFAVLVRRPNRGVDLTVAATSMLAANRRRSGRKHFTRNEVDSLLRWAADSGPIRAAMKLVLVRRVAEPHRERLIDDLLNDRHLGDALAAELSWQKAVQALGGWTPDQLERLLVLDAPMNATAITRVVKAIRRAPNSQSILDRHRDRLLARVGAPNAAKLEPLLGPATTADDLVRFFRHVPTKEVVERALDHASGRGLEAAVNLAVGAARSSAPATLRLTLAVWLAENRRLVRKTPGAIAALESWIQQERQANARLCLRLLTLDGSHLDQTAAAALVARLSESERLALRQAQPSIGTPGQAPLAIDSLLATVRREAETAMALALNS